jgi:hypothetical protein
VELQWLVELLHQLVFALIVGRLREAVTLLVKLHLAK